MQPAKEKHVTTKLPFPMKPIPLILNFVYAFCEQDCIITLLAINNSKMQCEIYLGTFPLQSVLLIGVWNLFRYILLIISKLILKKD